METATLPASLPSLAKKSVPEPVFAGSNALSARFHAAIPGGAHTYAKGDDQFPEHMAPYIVRGEGCRVWDVDGNEFIEFGAGLRSVTLGHAYGPVVAAARQQLELGVNFGRPAVLELETAEEFLDFVQAGEMVKFAKNGSDATSAAVKLARAYTGRNLVGICQDHPFFSVDDWFIGTTPLAAGIPPAISSLTVSFRYNDLASAEALFAAHPGQVACLLLEVEKEVAPAPGFLAGLRRLCDQEGAVLIFDEIITGFRWHNQGAQARYGVRPDLSTWGKALANGFSLAALTGRRELMERGGLHHSHDRVFLLSTTYGAETHALAAARAVMREYRTQPVVEQLWKAGRQLADGLRQAAQEQGVAEQIQALGQSCCLTYTTRDAQGQHSAALRTLFLQETLRRGLLMPSLIVNYSHTPAVISSVLERLYEVLGVYRRALEDGVEHYLVGEPVKSVYRTRN
ncbi:glutamate-1-semialdehyde 2,1-aminomutase [Microvirga sp. STR05]|uniref:Glutamate-1-semialdehyde 2,1-aminomutase n=1 Tax=Hymenobacter duratus TaxID=2771356 RepID=A0ABR8JI96_9BACT|nr:glutamate-1-semialdehyde 2,1-aminomutase [Hymenobacter duratus]MBD2715321.1 glutamate-1-semialdehyde 2,1-aminomutase [Hymenobacter duratus]MBR7950228.1 glutamate-1-semialdehyde 2,1-aminomutase [Microvirga sp. STR05]